MEVCYKVLHVLVTAVKVYCMEDRTVQVSRVHIITSLCTLQYNSAEP